MPPCRKICTGRLLPTPLPVAAAGGACCPAPAQLTCSCDDDEPEIACDEDTCANAADCKQLHPEICPHGLATDEECTACQPQPQPPARPELTLICPHCRSQISMFEDPKLLKNQSTMPQNQQQQPRKTRPVQKQPSYTRPPTVQDSATGCIQRNASNCSSVSCCSNSNSLKLGSPHISRRDVTKGDDLECPRPLPPPPPVAALSCCMSASAIRTAPHMGRTSSCESITCEGTGPKTCCEMVSSAPGAADLKQIKKASAMSNMGPPAPVCKICMHAAAGPPKKCCPVGTGSQPNQQGSQPAARPARGSSGKGKGKTPSPGGPNPNCPRSGAGALFPAKPPPQACLCRMPPAYTSGCTGNLFGNCNCASCNK